MALTNSIKENDLISVRQAIQQLSHLRLGVGSSPTFAGLTLTGLTASRLVWTNASKALASKDLVDLVAGTAKRVIVSDDSAGGVVLSGPQDLDTVDGPTFDTLTLSSIANEATDVDKFLVDSSGLIKYRTGAEVLSDISGSPTSHRHDTETLEHDAVNSDGGAFSFTTTGLVTFNQSIASANYTAANLLTGCATNAGALDFSAASKTLTVEDTAIVSQDYTSDATPTFAGVTLTDSAPTITIHNSTEEDADGGREGIILFRGEQSGGEESTLAEIRAAHSGVADNTLGKLTLSVNNSSVLTEALRIEAQASGDIYMSIGKGTVAPESPMHVISSKSDIRLDTYSTNATRVSQFLFRKSNSDTIGTLTETDDQDLLGQFQFNGVDTGGNTDYGAFMRVLQDGAAGGKVPTKFEFFTSNSGGANAAKLELWADASMTYGDGTNYTSISGTGAITQAGSADATLNKLTTTVGRVMSTSRYTANQTLDVEDHHVFCDTDGGAFTVILPAGVAGTEYHIANVGTSGNDVTLTPDGAELLIGANASFTLYDGESLDIVYEATEGWF